MGLLSDPETGSMKYVRIVRKLQRPISFLCCLAAVGWFFLLGHKAFNNATYFSENALLPGLVKTDFKNDRDAKQFYQEYLQELEAKYNDNSGMPIPWLVGKMSQLHLEVYTHNFTLDYPFGHGQVYKGTNVYGILRAPRTSNLEALVVTAPYRPIASHQKGTAASIALMLAFAKFARPQKYWAKDIIFLVTEHEQLGMQAWLEAYHGIVSDTGAYHKSVGSFWKLSTPNLDLGLSHLGLDNIFGRGTDRKKCLNPGKLKGRSGAIQAAINLEFHAPNIKYIEVKVEGLNGQLPNLDLFNLVNKMCVKAGINYSFKYSFSWIKKSNDMYNWKTSISTLFGMVSAQFAGVPNGNHGLFHRFGIEALTLEGRDALDPAGMAPNVQTLSSCNFHRLGVALEGTLRSLNNLLEKFHQSYFFYLLASTNRFVSIGQYMPALCFFCGAMLLRALCIWVGLPEITEEKQKSNKPNEENKEKVESLDENDENNKKEVEETNESEKLLECPKKEKMAHWKPAEPNFNLFHVGINYILMHFLGYVLMNSPLLLSKLGVEYFDVQPEKSIYYGIAIMSVIFAFAPHIILNMFMSQWFTYDDMSLINVVVLIELSTLCLTVGMHNFPMGLCVAALYTPLALTVRVVRKGGSERRFFIWYRRVLCLLSHPILLMRFGMALYSRYLFPEESTFSAVQRSVDASLQATMFSVVDSVIYGNWLFNVATSLIYPIWLLLWQISYYEAI